MTGVTLPQIRALLGLNARIVQGLLKGGVLLPLHHKEGGPLLIDPQSLSGLKEGIHYIRCASCGSFQAMISGVHLAKCCGLSLAEYQSKFPGSPTLSSFCKAKKVKSPAQKKTQSDKLLQRFQTPEGEKTRQQIGASSKRMQDSGYRDKASAHLRALNNEPASRAARSKESKARWKVSGMREAVEKWQQDHREEVLASAANARRHNKRKYTKLHQALKQALVRKGVVSVTEFEIGYYAVDEAIPDHKLIIEADGCYWHGCSVCGFPPRPGMHAKDTAKDAYMVRGGWQVLHFPGHRILQEADVCAEEVLAKLKGGQHA